ncbi:MAG: MFS transporter [Mycetocola sp.]
MTTTSSPSEPTAVPTPGARDAPGTETATERVKIRGPLKRLLFWLIPTNLGVFILWGAIPGVLLPIQVTGIDPANKVANLAIITTLGALGAMLAQPVAGAISDRTRTRFGRRAPWLVTGALVGGLALVGMSLADGIVQLAIAWIIVQIAYNFVQGPLSAIMPDRVPAGALGTFAALGGMAAMIGAIGGQVVGASFAQSVGTGYVLLAGLSIVAVTLFVVFNRDTSSRELDVPPFHLLSFIKGFWVSPVKHPDFFWAFVGRLLLYTGYFSVMGYNLFVLQDYVGLGDDAVGYVAVLGLLGLVAMIPAILISGPLSDRVGRRKIFVFISSVIVGVGFIIPWLFPSLGGMMAMAVVVGVGFGAFQSVDQALMTQVLPSADSFAKDLGVVNIAATLPQTLAPAVGGAVVLAFGYAGLFPIGIVLSVAGAFAVYMIKSVR